ncbi:hypothetical protein [Clostridium sp.]|uniref:hypothetical protein n=1 Tax=Clostridium sp. TaxID=1506 RepID=UPI00290A3C42|nr:hypothetical protein [Clostridium sp.]MDU6047118.1 hypothetical protein [Clostridium sp.]MDU6220584.1 hypothetical protein [Clostridium sp.]MDU6270933.1 hypothetical protein [Clostridium sp.]
MIEKITLFYLKRTGKVKCFCTGEQSMEYFADEKEDMALIMDFIVIDYDEFVIKNYDYYKVIEGNLIFDKVL